MNVSKEGEKRMGETREGYIPVGSRECGKQSKTVPRCHNNCRRPFFTFHISLIALLHVKTLVSIICDCWFSTALERVLSHTEQYSTKCRCMLGDSASPAVALLTPVASIPRPKCGSISLLPCVALLSFITRREICLEVCPFHVAGTPRKRGRMGGLHVDRFRGNCI